VIRAGSYAAWAKSVTEEEKTEMKLALLKFARDSACSLETLAAAVRFDRKVLYDWRQQLEPAFTPTTSWNIKKETDHLVCHHYSACA